MDILKDLLREQGPQLIQILTQRTAMDEGQAGAFLPAAAEAIVGALQGGKLDLGALLGGDLGGLLEGLDLGALARSASVDTATAESGVREVGPELLQGLQGRAGGAGELLSALGSGDADDLLGAAGSLAKKFLG